KVVFITGSTSGIGKSTAQMFLQFGAKVVFHGFPVTDTDRQFITDLQGQGHDVLLTEADVTDKSQVERIAEEIGQRYGRIDILVNNVGAYIKKATIEEREESDWDKTINVNLKSVFLVTKAVLPLMKQNGGRIINTTSLVERTGGTIEGLA